MQSKNTDICTFKATESLEVPAMIPHKTRFLSAAAAAAILIATVAVAHTVHTYKAPSDQPRLTVGKGTETPPAQTAPTGPHGNLACGMALDSDCERLEMLLPM